MAREIVQLHVHSEFSILDGCGKQVDFIAKAHRMGSPAVCFTEHGTLRGIHKLHETSSQVGIKPIYGVEFYAALDHTSRGLPKDELEVIKAQFKAKGAQNKAKREREEELGLRKRYHVTVLAKNNEGLKNLYRLSSIAWVDGFYMRPRIDFDLLEKYGDGLIVLSGCLDGFANQAILNGKPKNAIEYIERFHSRWGDDFYLEIMPNRLKLQQRVNRAVAKINDGFGIPLVATADVHYLERDDWQAHEVLLCVNTRKRLSDPNRWTFGSKDFWYQTREEMESNFSKFHPDLREEQIQQALDSTLEIAEKCEAKLELDKFRALLPEPTIPSSIRSEFAYLTNLCQEGWDSHDIVSRAERLAKQRGEKEIDVLAEYVERLMRELKQIKSQRVDKYFLIVHEMYRWGEERGILFGPGRGSVGGSLVAYLLGLTDVDPIEHGLIFERFLNPERIDMPDIDSDVEDRRRPEVLKYLVDRYGKERVAQISTVNRMAGKACLRDLSRVLEIPIGEAEGVIASIVQRGHGDEREFKTIEDAMAGFKVGRTFDRKYPEVLHYAKRLEGQARNLGLHAAGVIVSCDELVDWIPLETRAHGKSRVVCTGVDMWGTEAQGLMKIDVLGLRTLSVISDCLSKIKERHGEDINLSEIDIEDPKVLKNFTNLRFAGIFQFDTAAAEKMCAGVTFERFADIPALTALVRPGTLHSGLTADYLKRKADPKNRKSVHPVIDRICDDTLGVIVYQEHVIKLLVELAGFEPGRADLIRKAIAKKKSESELEEIRGDFVKGAVANGVKVGLAEKLMDQMVHFSGYLFNKSHATAYGLLSYRQMWLKTYYSAEFMWALLANEPDHQRKIKLLQETRRMGIPVLPPSVNESGPAFVINEAGEIRSGLVDVKGVGKAAVSSIQRHQPFESLIDLVSRVDLRQVNKGVIAALVKAGAMKELVPNVKWFLENANDLWKKRNRKGWQELLETELEKSRDELEYDDEELELLATEVSPLAFGRHPIEPYSKLLDPLAKWTSTGDDDVWEKPWVWIRGVVSSIKINKIGDFHTGMEPDDEEKLKMSWGSRYANLQVEDHTGSARRVKVGHDIFSDVREIIDKGVGTPVAIMATVNAEWNSLRARILLDVSELRRKVIGGEELTSLESALFSPGELWDHFEGDDLTRRLRRRRRNGEVMGRAFVVSVQRKIDKNLNEMGFVTLFGAGGAWNTVCFASVWQDCGHLIQVGSIIEARVTVKGNSYFLEDVDPVKFF